MRIIIQAECNRCYDQGIKCYDECLKKRESAHSCFQSGQLKEVLVGLASDLSIDS